MMEIIDTIQNLNECWGPLEENWFDYFIDVRKLSQLLTVPGNKEIVSELALQFAEQAANTQKEHEVLISNGSCNEDVQFSLRKAACLFLCATACFAYIDWDIDHLIDKYNEILSVRILVENFLGMCRSNDCPCDVKKGGLSLSVGIIGNNVLCQWAPRPVFDLSTTVVPANVVVNVSRFELLQFHFSNGAIEAAQGLLKMVTLPEPMSPLFAIDRKLLNGYHIALNVPSPLPPIPTTVKEFVPDQNLLTDDQSVFRRFRMWRLRAVKRTTGQLQVAFRSENVAKDVLEGCATSVRERLTDKVVQQRFIKSLQRQMPFVRDEGKRRRINALLLFLCATISGMREELLRCGWDAHSRLRTLASQVPKSTIPPLSTQIVKLILANDNPFWTIVTSFSAVELKQAMNKLDRFVRPSMFVLPEMSAECVLVTRPINELHAVLLAKLHQLSEMRNSTTQNRIEWDTQCTAYWQEFGLLSNCQIVMLTEEYDDLILTMLSHEAADTAADDRQLRSMKKLFTMNADADLLKKPGGTAFAAQTFARALNAEDWDFITAEVKFSSITTTMAQLLAAYLMSSAPGKDASQLRKVCDTLNAHVSPFFDQGSRNGRRDLNRSRDRDDRDRAASVIEMSRFLKFKNINILAVQELLEMFFRIALTINPTNSPWLRSAADFQYGRGLLNEAGILYMEYLLASRQALLAGVQEAQSEDVIWHRLRVCLARSQYFTLASLICQLIEHKREDEYIKSMELLFSELPLDAGANYSGMVFDNTLAEYLSDVYERNHMQHSADLLFSNAYASCMNPEGRDVLAREQSRRTQRLLRTLAAQLFDVHF
uniref:Integrator complex subunit 8 n=1 Tax=Angiostrongylus cantonensis TaxID=6313 RepID=A0A158P5S5_ANGCA